ncbi:AsnC family transcriptional regulator [Deltaproteobacteria bacterium]|nr:AsnC family transcriptional regulator [Deltaproteobacteria bacterium]
MGVSVKCQYGLRALYELSRRWGGGVVRISEIAEAQDIPISFLESIMTQLRQGGFVMSRRGKYGGFQLARHPSSIALDEVIEFIDGGIYSVDCEGDRPLQLCKLKGRCVFLAVWKEARDTLTKVYKSKTLQDLLDLEQVAEPLNFII